MRAALALPHHLAALDDAQTRAGRGVAQHRLEHHGPRLAVRVVAMAFLPGSCRPPQQPLGGVGVEHVLGEHPAVGVEVLGDVAGLPPVPAQVARLDARDAPDLDRAVGADRAQHVDEGRDRQLIGLEARRRVLDDTRRAAAPLGTTTGVSSAMLIRKLYVNFEIQRGPQ